ncbi:MFS transporter [Falsigemmobacter faecalis]|uniref:MFS transporter n=1 Tax=Falsigemmobacter faecalis TaxID=2488730 RepID=A0A3P3DGV7_9RHOB|nr:MFS transporter [Falsigemmobacter faecalis]RRH73499.1 MFS transporter [Falsigemmobacter faecalis]
MSPTQKRIRGWYFFDFASQPYNTLLLTFIFGPYVVSLIGDGSAAQAIWGYGVGLAGLAIAILSPILGAIADKTGRRMGFIVLFSLLYVLGAWGLWWSSPQNFNIWWVMFSFSVGLIGMEFATTFTNAMMPDLAPREELGRISGSGWAFGYVGGVIALAIMLLFFAEGSDGTTLIGLAPLFGLDGDTREGTRFVGPFTAIWFAVFMVPFFLWVREPRRPGMGILSATRRAFPDTLAHIRALPANRSLMAYLVSSTFYRDALNGMYTFGGIYASGVLGWSVTNVGIFGILAAITGAIFAWWGGRLDSRFGPKPVIAASVFLMLLVCIAVVFISRTEVFGLPVGPESLLPDIAFYVVGCLIGAGGGVLQSASRTMMVRQAHPHRMTEDFGLYALTGKAMAWMAPLSIAVTTQLTGSQQLGILPLIGLFLIGLVLLVWVRPEGGNH